MHAYGSRTQLATVPTERNFQTAGVFGKVVKTNGAADVIIRNLDSLRMRVNRANEKSRYGKCKYEKKVDTFLISPK